MRIALVSTAVPLVQGGGRFIVDWLQPKLVEAGHQVEKVWLPQADDPETLFQQMQAFRLIELDDSFDRVITFRPQSHVVRHRHKIVWFIHHIRQFYDLWHSAYNDEPKTSYREAFRRALVEADTSALKEAKRIFANSKVVRDRIETHNGLKAEVLYPPVVSPERFTCEAYGGEIAFICRVEHHKRQHLAIEAMRYATTPVRLRIAGDTMTPPYADLLRQAAVESGVADKVTVDMRWISEGEKTSLLSTALAAVYVPVDEDSYGYPTLEAALACKCTVTVDDAGGVREFVEDGVTGLVVPAEAKALAGAFDRLWSDRDLARRLGREARRKIDSLDITWNAVVERLTA